MKILSEKEYQEIISRLNDLEQQAKDNQKSPQEVFYDNQEFLLVMHISKRTAQKWRNDNLIAYSQVEGKIYYKHTDVLEMLNRNHKPAFKKKESLDVSH
nr:helix-turn-helix domain-containing protein [uncultured Pedobacter sp.]